jgi:hypothetical protein
VEGSTDWREVQRDGLPGAEFSWEGSDEGDQASGRGWGVIEEDGSLRGRIFFHLGDDSSFTARARQPAAPARRTRWRCLSHHDVMLPWPP